MFVKTNLSNLSLILSPLPHFTEAIAQRSGKMYVTVSLTVTDQVECETHTATNTCRQSCVVVGQRCATLASDPSHTPPQQHSSISRPPPTHALLQVCLPLNGGRGRWGREGIRCHLKKQLSGLAENGA